MEKRPDKEEGILFRPIGVIRTPYTDWAPQQPVEREPEQEGRFRLVVYDEFSEGLKDLDRFTHIYVLSFLDRARKSPPALFATPPWAEGRKVGLFASRSPFRPNPIGLSIVRLNRIEGNELLTFPIDVFDGTPLLDIKPYFGPLDAKADANAGWAEDLKDSHHRFHHLRGLPHDH